MNLIGFKREPEGAFYLRLRGSCGATQPQLGHLSATAQPLFSHEYRRPQAKEYPSGLQPLTLSGSNCCYYSCSCPVPPSPQALLQYWPFHPASFATTANSESTAAVKTINAYYNKPDNDLARTETSMLPLEDDWRP
jgi:hypothetical protein